MISTLYFVFGFIPLFPMNACVLKPESSCIVGQVPCLASSDTGLHPGTAATATSRHADSSRARPAALRGRCHAYPIAFMHAVSVVACDLDPMNVEQQWSRIGGMFAGPRG